MNVPALTTKYDVPILSLKTPTVFKMNWQCTSGILEDGILVFLTVCRPSFDIAFNEGLPNALSDLTPIVTWHHVWLPINM